MKNLVWDEKKNERLKKERGIGFEQAILAIIGDGFIKVEKNLSSNHANQYVYVLNINNYGYLVPFVEDNDRIFLKTIIPSRKATKKYITNFKN